MEFASFLKLLSKTNGYGFGFFVFGCFSQFFNLAFICCLLVLGLKFLFFKSPSLCGEYLKRIDRNSPKIECCNSFDSNGFVSKAYLGDELDQKKPIILRWTSDSPRVLSLSKKTNTSFDDCDFLLLRDGIDLSENRESTASFPEAELDEKNHHGGDEGNEDEELEAQSDEDQVFNVITLRKMVKRERKRGDILKIELEKERRAAESAAEEAMAMLLKLRMEKNAVEMEAKQYKRVAEQKQGYDQEVIQSLQWMLMKLDDKAKIQDF